MEQPAGGIPSLRARHLAIAALAALCLHAAAAAGVFWQSRQIGAQAEGSGGLEVGIAGAVGAPSAAASAEEVEADTVEEIPAPDVLEAVAEKAEAVTEVEAVEAEPVADTQPLIEETATAVPPEPVAPVIEPETAAETAPALPVEQAAPDEEVVAVEAPRPTPRPAPSRPPVRAKPKPKPTPKPVSTPKPSPPARRRQAEPAPAQSAANTQPAPDASDASSGASGGGASGGGNPGAEADYKTLIQARLARAKVYPRRALARRQEGVGRLRFTIESNGQARGGAVIKSSGHDLIDKAILDMLRRAQPFPAIPASVGRTRITFELDVRFRIP